MHCPWVRKTRVWGYEVIRGIDEDDPARVIRAFKYPIGLAFVDLNAQVCSHESVRPTRRIRRCGEGELLCDKIVTWFGGQTASFPQFHLLTSVVENFADSFRGYMAYPKGFSLT